MPTLRLGLFGLRGAGKTVALAVAYLTEDCEGLEVTVRDEATIRYVRPSAEALQRGEVPPPTMVADPAKLRWSVRFGQSSYELETIDFAGELLDALGQSGDAVTEEMIAHFRRQVRDWFISCDAVVLFINGTDHGTPRYRDALTRLLDEMSQRPTIRGSHQRAVVVVFTKADQLAQSPEELFNPSESKRILERHPLYQIVERRLTQRVEQVRFGVFLASALGWRFVSVRNPSQRQVLPCNFFAALRWGLEQAAQIVHGLHSQVLDELNQELDERRTGSSSWVWALVHSRSLNKILNATDRDYQLAQGPYATRFSELCGTVQRARSYQLGGLVASCIGVILIVLTMCWHRYRGEQIAVYDTYDHMVSDVDSGQVVTQRFSYYRTSIEPRKRDWFWLLTDRRKSAEIQAIRDAEWVTVTSLPFGTSDQCEAKCRQLHDYVRRIDALCREDAKTMLQNTSVAWYNMLAVLPTQTCGECEHKVSRLKKYADQDDAYCCEQARTLIQTTSTAWYDLLATLPMQTCGECEGKVSRLKKYADRDDAYCREQARTLIQTTSTAWYNLLAALPTQTRDDCEEKARRLKEYADREDAYCRKQANIWFDVLREGTDYLNDNLGSRRPGKDYWEFSTGWRTLNLNPMFTFVDDKWQVRWKKTESWHMAGTVLAPSGKGEIETNKILDKLEKLNQNLPGW